MQSNPWDKDPVISPAAGPVYGAPPKPVSPYAEPQAQANLQRTQQEVSQAQATASALTERTQAESQSAQIAAKNAQEAYDAAHPKGTGATIIGPDSLKVLSVPDQELVKALAEGRLAFPAGFALKAPWWQQKLEQVAQYDPTFDATNFNNRAKARATLLTGKIGTSANALNTAIGHIGLLSSQIGGTASHGPWSVAGIPIPGATTVNAVENSFLRSSGQSGITNFQDTASKLADELESVYRNGGGAEQGVVRQLRNLDPNMSGEQKQGIIRNALGLLSSKQAANLYQYNIGSGGKPAVDLLDPAARQVLDQFPDIRDKYFAQPSGPLSSAAAALIQANGGQPPPAPPAAPSMPGGTPPLPNDPLTPSGGGTKEVIDPNLTPVRREYTSRLQAGQTGAQLVGFLRSAGVNDPKLLQAAQDQAAFRRKNPNIPIQQFDTSAIDHITQKMGLVNRAVNAAGQTDVGAAVAGAGNAMTAGFMPDIIGATGGNETQARIAMQQQAQDHPTANLVGTIAGGTGAALSGEAALGALGKGAGFGRSLLADTLYGGAAGAGGSPDNRTGGAIMGGLAGAGGSLLGQGIAKGASAAFRGVTNKSVNAMADAGVPLTVGQAAGQSGRVGSVVKGVEDRLSGIPGVGNMIQARRAEGMAAFNSKAFDKALEPVGGSVKGAVGEEAVANARQTVSDAFSAALKGKSAVPDQEFVSAARGPLERLASIKRNDLGPEIVQQIEESTKDLFDPHTGALSGENMQSFLEALRQIRQSYKGDPLYARVIKPSIQGIENSVSDMFARQAPEVVPAFNAAKAAYRRVSVLADAVDKGKQTEGVFTPAQLGMADRTNAKRFDGKLSAASGESPFFNLQRAGQNVLPNKVPDSGTAGRLAVMAAPGLLTGAGAGAGYVAGDTKSGAEAGLGLTGILALAYTKTGQKRLAAMLLSRNPQARAIAEAISKRVPIAGAAGTALTQTSAGP